MIRIDSTIQPSNGGSVRTSHENPSPVFAQLLSEQVVKVTEADKSKQFPNANNQLPSSQSAYTTHPRDELERLVSMSPSELIRYQILEQMGLTEEGLKELPFEERMKIEEKIQEQVERLMGEKASKKDTAAEVLP